MSFLRSSFVGCSNSSWKYTNRLINSSCSTLKDRPMLFTLVEFISNNLTSYRKTKSINIRLTNQAMSNAISKSINAHKLTLLSISLGVGDWVVELGLSFSFWAFFASRFTAHWYSGTTPTKTHNDVIKIIVMIRQTDYTQFLYWHETFSSQKIFQKLPRLILTDKQTRVIVVVYSDDVCLYKHRSHQTLKYSKSCWPIQFWEICHLTCLLTNANTKSINPTVQKVSYQC